MKKVLLSVFALFFVLSAVYSVTNMANAGFFDFLFDNGEDSPAAASTTDTSSESVLYLYKNKSNGGRVYGGIVTQTTDFDCPTGESKCKKSYTKGDSINLVADPEDGYAIDKWRGCDGDGGKMSGNTCSVNMKSKKEKVKVYFKKLSSDTSNSEKVSNTTSNSTSVPILTIERKSKNYYGMVEVSSQYTTDPGRDLANTVSASDNCQLTSSDSDNCIYSLPTTVEYVYYTLKAVPSEDAAFKKWTGCDKVEDETCSVTAYNKSETVKVYFKNAMPKKKLTLYVYDENNSTSGSGGVWPGNVVIEKNGIQKEKCLSECSDLYSYGSVLTLTATPNSGYEFDKWSGCKSGSNENECEVTMKSNKRVKAYFKKTEETTDDDDGGDVATRKLKITTYEYDGKYGYLTLSGDDGTTKYCMSESVSTGSSNPDVYQRETCEFSYGDGVKVTITPTAYSSDTMFTPEYGNDFTCDKDEVCVVTMNGDKSDISYGFRDEATSATNSSPTTSNSAATNVTSSSATLNGLINPAGDTIYYIFKYGTDSNWSKFKETDRKSVSNNTAKVSADISGLTSGTTYYYYISAYNSSNTYIGKASAADNWGSFTTEGSTATEAEEVSTSVSCVSWRQTGNNRSDGPREEYNDKSCDTTIDSGWSGYCECSDGSTVEYNTGHASFKCSDVCSSQ